MKAFVCSLCRNGILGGGLYLDEQSLVYKTNKLTVDQKYRRLVMPLQQIKEISWKWMVFPACLLHCEGVLASEFSKQSKVVVKYAA